MVVGVDFFFFWVGEVMVIGCGGWLCWQWVVGGCFCLIEKRETESKRQRNEEYSKS